MQNKNVQIPYELFFQLLQYFLMDNYDGEEIIRLGLEKKLDAMVNREVYSKSKTAPTEEEREKFRHEIANLFIKSNFHCRQANKSFLQMIEYAFL